MPVQLGEQGVVEAVGEADQQLARHGQHQQRLAAVPVRPRARPQRVQQPGTRPSAAGHWPQCGLKVSTYFRGDF